MKKLLALLNKPIPHTPKPGVLLLIGFLLFVGACWWVLPRVHGQGSNLLLNGDFTDGLNHWTDFAGTYSVSDQGNCGDVPPYGLLLSDYSGASSAAGQYFDWGGGDLSAFVTVGGNSWPGSLAMLQLYRVGYDAVNTQVYLAGGDVVMTVTYSSAPAGQYRVLLYFKTSWGIADGSYWGSVWAGASPPPSSCSYFSGTPTPTATSTLTATLTPIPPMAGCLALPDGGFDAVPITSTWYCTAELGQTEHTLFVEPDGITDNTLYWLQDMRFNYPVGEGCYRVGTVNTFQITETGLYIFTLDYSLVPGIEGINALWTTAGLIANFPGGPNGPDSQFWTGRLVALDGVTTTITGSQYFSQTGPYYLFFQFIPRRDPFLDGPGTDVIYVDNACVKNQPDATPTPTITPSPTTTPTATPTGTISPTETPTVTPTPTPWGGPPPTNTPGGPPPTSTPIPTPGGPTPTPQPPQQAGFCDSTTAPPFPPDDGTCGPDVWFLSDPVGWVRQQICRLVGLFPRSFTWLGWFLQWLFCPILDVIGGLLCALAVVVPMIQSFLNMVAWIWNFIIAAFTAFNFEKDKPVTVFTDFMGGWIWIELTDVIAKLKATTFFGWLFDWFVRALLWWNTFTWFMNIAASGAGESSTEAQDSEGE